MPRMGPRRPLELGKSVVEFRLTSADADIKALLEAEGNISATIRRALRLYALHRSSGIQIPAPTRPEAMALPSPEASPKTVPPKGDELHHTAQGLLVSLEADWE